MNSNFDVCVLGGGPAGAQAARLLAVTGRRVALVEASDFREDRVGEHISADLAPLVESLGEPQSKPDWFADGTGRDVQWETPALRPVADLSGPRASSFNVVRNRFDQAMAQAAVLAGATLFTGMSSRQAELTQAGWRLIFGGRDSSADLNSDLVIDASGRAAVFARTRGAQIVRADRLVAVVAWVETPGPTPTLLIEASANGWWYSVGLPDGRTVAGYITHPNLLRDRGPRGIDAWTDALSVSLATRERLSTYKMLSWRQTRVGQGRLSSVWGPGWLATGDAAAHYDPLWGRGVPYAMELASRAAEAACLDSRHHAQIFGVYERSLFDHYDKVLRDRVAIYATANNRFPGFSERLLGDA